MPSPLSQVALKAEQRKDELASQGESVPEEASFSDDKALDSVLKVDRTSSSSL